ncbi:3D domain-containing protein [Luteolibacter sp. GHJ8]|uniref:3D domain-containing protein n=1 Tax=Luteolibacter rhizosphaerae TaxID=2989719 RepID=A0ABT3FZ14_9BACT|nr:3D domain-containing protein [Luteolibacter rhizosphaerae]MCW1912564.1 3D domain-containing protein [Luteolibacter rhizosphaerae]
MIFRLASAAALAALFLSSCASDSDLKVLSKTNIKPSSSSSRGYYDYSSSNPALSQAGGFTTAQPSSAVVAQTAGKPKDKHGMPFYKASDRTRLVRTTAYTCSEDDHIEYGSMNAAGTPLRYTDRVRSAAADWAVYPLGTVFRIKGMSQLFVVDDYGSALTGTNTVDIYTPSKAHMGAWGRRNVELTVVQWGSYARSAEVLSKRTHYAHCAQMYAAINKMTAGRTAATASR